MKKWKILHAGHYKKYSLDESGKKHYFGDSEKLNVNDVAEFPIDYGEYLVGQGLAVPYKNIIERGIANLKSTVSPKKPPSFNATDGAIDLAKSERIDLGLVKGSGTKGRITKDDVQSFLKSEVE